MKSLRKVASVVAGGFLIGSALGGMASAGLDPTGLSKGFFYDSNYNPIMQIVVGENSLGPDSIAAGNIAAVIGNLAYTTRQTTIASDNEAEGRVVLGVSARGASGRYEQADHGLEFETDIGGGESMIGYYVDSHDSGVPSSFYEDTEGLNWTHGEPQIYEKGEFVTYSLSCETQRTDAGILKEATYNNIHCLFCETLCLEQLENPEHTMSESIIVDWASMRWFEDGLNSKDAEVLTLKIPSKSVEYRVDTQCIPMEKITTNNTAADAIDFEWRGKMLLFGEEYYVKNIKGNDKVYLAKGKVLDDVTSEGYTSEYLGYKFKIDHLIYSAEFQVAGLLLDVEKPDGTVVQTQISKLANGIVDDIEIAGVYAEESDAVATASVLVYDTTTNVLLEDGKDIELGGEVKKYWKVILGTGLARNSDDITEYEGTTGDCLENVTVQYRHSIQLAEGESLQFPSTFLLTFDGYRKQADFSEVPCSGAGEGNIRIDKYQDFVALMSFTGDDGQRYDDVRMDNGPFDTGELFILDGGLYEYVEYEQDQQTTTNEMKVVLRDVLSGGKNTYRLSAYYNEPDFEASTYSFEEAAENDIVDVVEVDPNINDTDVFDGYIDGIYAMWISDTLSFGEEASGLDGGTFGTFNRFDENGNALTLSILNENGTVDKNHDGNADDRLLVFSNEQGEYAVVDLYDRSYNSSEDNNLKYKEGALSTDSWSGTTGVSTANISAKLDDEDDTLLILPDGGDRITVDYGSNLLVKSFSVCHPRETVKATAFIGTSEEEILIESVITKDDEGKEQTVGCCTYTVKEFSVKAKNAGQTVTENILSPVTGGLVVSEVGADSSRNLVIVGGPAVNTLSTVTAAELAAASDRYIVKKDGSKLIVAGYDAKDTVAAGNALIAWLRQNAHA